VHEVQAGDSYKDKPEINRITAQPASFARKVSGSYYTHDDLVRLILRESVGLLATERMDALDAHLKKLAKKASLNPPEWEALDAKDPAAQILELKICDPAMGSGHFLVALVDDLADRVLEAMNTATHSVNAQGWAAHLEEAGRPWQSPLVARIAQIRRSIKTTAKDHGWTVTDAQLDDRHIVRRGASQNRIVAAHVYRGRTAVFLRPSPENWRQFAWRKAGCRATQPARFGRVAIANRV
jgi:hypothetical protein